MNDTTIKNMPEDERRRCYIGDWAAAEQCSGKAERSGEVNVNPVNETTMSVASLAELLSAMYDIGFLKGMERGDELKAESEQKVPHEYNCECCECFGCDGQHGPPLPESGKP